MPKPKSKAKALIKIYKSVQHHVRQIDRLTACWYIEEKAGANWTDSEKTTLAQGSRYFNDAQTSYDIVMSEKIGEAITREIRGREGGW